MKPALSRLERMLGPAKPPCKKAPAKTPGNLPPGEWLAEGVYRIRHSYPCETLIGAAPLADGKAPTVNLEPWGADEPSLFLDLETTGLAGGTGTYAFLAGLGRFEENRFVVDQLFLTTPACEEAWLEEIENLMPPSCGFVSYNGKRFDLPLLETRFVLQRKQPSWNGNSHLDLLHLARAFWKRSLPTCRLADVERYILELEREGTDVPGALVPELYRLFLKDGDAAPLGGVFYHNRMDILSLAALRTRLAFLLDGEEGSARERVAAGDIWFRRGHYDRAGQIWDRTCRSDMCAPALERLADLARKRQNWVEAANLWEKALPFSTRPVEILVELAKIFEHRTKETDKALEMTEKALVIVMERRAFMGSAWRPTREALLHRRGRLTGKIKRDTLRANRDGSP